MTNADKIRNMTNEDAIKYIENHGYIDDVVKDIAINAIKKNDKIKLIVKDWEGGLADEIRKILGE